MIVRSTNVQAALRSRQRGFLLNPFRFGGGGGSTDPYFSNVSLLLHMNGADGSTTFTDNSPNAFPITTYGNAQIDTAQSKFGGASGLFDGTGDAISAPNDADFDFGSGAFTVEFFLRLNSSASCGLITKRANTSSFSPFSLYYDASVQKVGALSSNNGTSWGINFFSSTTISTATWYHFALVRNSNTFTLYQNGVSVGSGTMSGALTTNTSVVSIGVASANNDFSINGWLDEMRITKGVARYTANFTPPSEQFPDS